MAWWCNLQARHLKTPDPRSVAGQAITLAISSIGTIFTILIPPENSRLESRSPYREEERTAIEHTDRNLIGWS